MSWPWIVLLALAVVVVVAAEWSRLQGLAGGDARRRRDRERRKARRVVEPQLDERDEFVESVRRDLDALPTIEERERGAARSSPAYPRTVKVVCSTRVFGRIRATFSMLRLSW